MEEVPPEASQVEDYDSLQAAYQRSLEELEVLAERMRKAKSRNPSRDEPRECSGGGRNSDNEKREEGAVKGAMSAVTRRFDTSMLANKPTATTRKGENRTDVALKDDSDDARSPRRSSPKKLRRKFVRIAESGVGNREKSASAVSVPLAETGPVGRTTLSNMFNLDSSSKKSNVAPAAVKTAEVVFTSDMPEEPTVSA